MSLGELKFSALLYGLLQTLRVMSRRHPAYARRLAEKDLTAQIRTADGKTGRHYTLRQGRITSGRGLHPSADITVTVQNADLGVKLFSLHVDHLERIEAIKNFQLLAEGPDELVVWFMQTLGMIFTLGWDYGTDLGDGVRRYVTNTNGGPLFVYVKDGRIVRITPIEFDDSDAPPWTIQARGKRFTPPRQTTVAPHSMCAKSTVYSPSRLLYPMKRVDFDPNGERNCENRGISGYVRISWDEALDIVAAEIQRVKRDFGPGAIMANHGSHHTWGNVGYYISAAYKFFNAIGTTKVVHNPDSWEGWYWGAMHHFGYSMRLGQTETYGLVEDLLKEAEMVVFWSADPECTSGSYSAFEGTSRRQWLKELGIELVHIDPYYNHTAALLGGKWFAPKPGTDAAMAIAIAQVWITEGLYDKDFVGGRTVGFETWRDYLLGRRGRRGQDARVAGSRDRHPGEGRARARAALGDEEDLSRRRRLGQRPRRRLPLGDRHPVGAHAGVPDGHAGHGPARRQLRPAAVGHADRPHVLLSRLRGRRHVRRHREHRPAASATTSACRSCRRSTRRRRRFRGCRSRRPSSRARPRATPGTARPSRGSSRSSATRRPGTRWSRCSTSTAARRSAR